MNFKALVALVALAIAYNHLSHHSTSRSYRYDSQDSGGSYDRDYMRRRYSRIPTTMPDIDRNSPDEPNRQLTPGATLPVSISDLCVVGYTKTVRSVPSTRRREVFQEYGLVNYRGGYEVDHLISLELGGSNSIQNLWPETKHTLWNAYVKDRLENRLHEMVCSGKMTLPEAQREISTDWIGTYKRLIAPQPQHENGSYED